MEQISVLVGVFGLTCFLILGLFTGKDTSDIAQERIMRALGRIESETEEESGPPLKERVFRPVLHFFAATIARMAPKGRRSKTAARLSAAGLAGQWESIEWQGLQLGFGALVGLVLITFFSVLHAALFWRMEVGIVGFLIGYLFPDSWLKAKASQRKKEIQDTLPDILDLLTVSVEAGLGFDAALLKVVEKQRGALAQEFLRVLQEIKMGRPRREALRDLGKRNQVEDLSNVLASIVQADQLGISIGGVLRNQSAQIRQKHRQRAEEKAQKAPVKMMIPLVFFVFPSIFIIILGPAVIQVLNMFSKN